MPFQSSRQERWMFANHPAVAKRWVREYGNARKLGQKQPANPESHSNESPDPAVVRLPRLDGKARSYRMLTPPSKARHQRSTPASEHEATMEGPVTFVEGSRHRELGTPEKARGLLGRDVRVAAKAAKR